MQTDYWNGFTSVARLRMSLDPALLKHLEFSAVLEAIQQHYPTLVAHYFAQRLQPSFDPDEVQHRLCRAQAWHFIFARYLPPSFTRGIEDISPILKRVQSASLTGSDFVELLKFLKHYESFRAQVADLLRRHLIPDVLQELHTLPSFAEEKAELDRVFDENGGVRETASPRIQAIFREQRRLERHFGAFVDQFLQEKKEFLQENIVTQRRGRTVLLVRTDRFQPDKFLVYEPSTSRASVYAEPLEFIQFNNERQQLAMELEQEIQALLAQFSRMIALRIDALEAVFEIFIEASFYGAVTQWSREVSASYPEVNHRNAYHLVRARHPLFPQKCIPNDLILGEHYTILVLSGPNAGGKTVLLKTLGLLVLMALCGLPVTADPGSTIAVPTAIVGVFSEDPGVLSTLSTFTSHLLPLKEALNYIALLGPEKAERMLLLLDELGTGTDPDEGAAFADAVLRWLQPRGPRVLISTHFPRLKILKYAMAGVENAGLGYDLEKMVPTYRLHYGVPGPSYGITVARKFGIPEEIVQEAERVMESPTLPLEKALVRAQYELEEARKIREEAEARAQVSAEREAQLTQRERNLERDLRDRYLQRVRNAEALVRGWVARAEELFKRLESEIKTAKAVRESREALWELYRSVREWKEGEESPGVIVPSLHPERSTRVLYYPPIGQMVKVLTPEDSEGYVWIQIGETRLKVPSASLRELPEPSTVSAEPPQHGFARSLDIRGRDSETAVLVLDQFLNRAFSAGVGEVVIIHGKGTGKLRQAVHDFLQGHSLVKSYHIVPTNAGVTKVVLVSHL
ncbi:MAG: endonuclease MutS2 [bacterium JZ-2024 1]